MSRAPFPLDAQQQQAVDARDNVVVSAGAGSGKTRVLTERYIAIITDNASEVSRILTLTFTRKAAAEMFERIYSRLGAAARDNPAVAAQLERIDDAPISTLDSFCARVVRDAATAYGVSPAFRNDEAALARLDAESAVAFLTTRTEGSPLAALTAEFGLQRVLDGLLTPLAVEHLRMSDPLDFGAIAERQIAWIGAQVDASAARCEEFLSYLQNYPAPTKTLEKVAALVAGVSVTPESIALLIERYRLANITVRKAGAKATIEHAEWAQAAQGLLRKSSSGKKTPEGEAYVYLRLAETLARADDLRALMAELSAFQDAVIERRRGAGLLSFGEVMHFALRALTEDHQLRAYYKSRFDFIMIDEFQDNNALQRDLLYLLAERSDRCVDGIPSARDLQPNKLFFVGDQKQSIYRFRGAEVGVFKALEREMPAAAGRALALATNYRSEPRLIAFFNTFFEAIFGFGEETFEARFEPLAHRPAKGVPCGVELHVVRPLDESDEEGSADELAEAAWIARRIETLVAQGTPVADGERTRPMRYGDIAILMRSTGNQQRYERLLRLHGIPYQTQAVRSLFLDAPAGDLYAILQVALFPEDRTAYATVLRSPFVGLSDRAVVAVLDASTDLPAAPFAAAVAVHALNAPEMAADRERYEHGVRLYARLLEMIDIRPHTSVLAYLWYEAGYRYAILTHARYGAFLEHYDYLFALAEADADRPLAAFVARLRENMGKTEKLDEVDVAAEDAVQLMTVHRSKGLQFPVVFVVGLRGTVSGGDTSRLFTMSSELGPCCTLPERSYGDPTTKALRTHAQEDESLLEAAELRRLLYVACTRAEQLLYLTTALPKSGVFAKAAAAEEGEDDPDVDAERASSFLDLVAAALRLQFNPLAADERYASLITLGWIDPIGADALRHPRGEGRRAWSYLSELLEGADVVRRVARGIDFSPSLLAHGTPTRAGVPAAPATVGGAEGTAGALPTATDGAAAKLEPAESDQQAAAAPPAADGVAAKLEPAESDQQAAAFGTLVHAMLEYRLGGAPVPHTPDTREPLGRLPSELGLDPAAWGAARDMCEAFFESSFWRSRAAATPGIHSEYPFLWFVPIGEGAFVHGRIDLILEYRDRIEIVDFKTDTECAPDLHRVQLALYKRVAAELFGRPAAQVEAVLYYLRHARAVPVLDGIDDRELEALLERREAPPATGAVDLEPPAVPW